MKKFLAILLVAVMATAMFAVPASAEAVPATVPKVNTAPTKDGVKDAVYAQGLKMAVDKPDPSKGTPPEGLKVDAYLLHDGTNLYIFVEVLDPAIHSKDYYNLSVNAASNGAHITSGWKFTKDTAVDACKGGSTLVELYSATGTLEGGFTTEIVLPLTDVTKQADGTVCMDIAYDDYDANGTRTSVLCAATAQWNWGIDNAYKLTLGTTAVDAQQGGNTGSGTGTGTGSTNTGDNTVALVGLALVSAIALAGVQLSKKRI